MTPTIRPPRALHPALGYLVAVLAVALASLVRWALIPTWGGSQLPYFFFFLAAILVAGWARVGPALLTVLGGAIVGNALFAQPPGIPTGVEAMRTAGFLASSLAAILAIEAIHRANARALAEVAERRRSEEALAEVARRQGTLYRFTDRVQRADTLEVVYDAALEAILSALGCDRASILLFDGGEVMRFVGWRGLSEGYRRAVEGHSPWSADTRDPTPVTISDVDRAEMDEDLRRTVKAEGLAALAFVPLVADQRLLGKFMAYFDAPHGWTEDEMGLALTVARQLAFAIAHKRDETALRDSEQRLEQALAAGRMGAWEWNVRTGRMIWSPGLEQIHGFAPGVFDGTIEAYQQYVHPEDREAVSASLERVGREGGPYHLSYRIRRPDGVQRWVEAFGRVKPGSGGTPELVSGVCMDITERRQDETERERILEREHQLRQAAEEANRLKDEFLATLSHELRNPLNAILGYSELLLRTCESEELRSLRPIGEALKRNSLVQSNLIRDLLDLSRLRSGKVGMNLETFDLFAAARNAVHAVRAEAAAKSVSVELEDPEGIVFARADLLRFGQVAWNLLNNAVKFTPAQGRVSVRVGREGEQALFTVEDTGQGIEPDFLPHIFEMFRQADPSTTRTHAGMGIGLALVRQLVELQGGSVSVHSDGHGLGARFVVRLPAGAEAELPAPAPAVPAAESLAGTRVLVVDDSEDTTEMLQRLLESYGATVTTANSGAHALALAAQGSWTVILSDISMPGMDGFEFLRRLRALAGQESVPVLALTGYGQAEDVRRAGEAGFFTHMTKPVDLRVLVQILQDVRARALESAPPASAGAAASA